MDKWINESLNEWMHACLGICSCDSLTATPVHGEIKKQKNALFTHHLFEGFAVSGQLCLSPIPVGWKCACIAHRTTISHNSRKKRCQWTVKELVAGPTRIVGSSSFQVCSFRHRCAAAQNPPRAADSTACDVLTDFQPGLWRIKDSH